MSYSCALDGSNYRLRRIRSPQAVSPAQVTAELDHLRAGYLKGDARLVKETRIVVDGVIGDDLTYTVPSSQGPGVVTKRTRHFINGHFYYELTAASPPDKPLPGDAARFLSSLTFGNSSSRRTTAGMKEESRSPARPVTAAPQPNDEPAAKSPAPGARVDLADSTPEDALTTFLLALAAQDEVTLRAVTTPDDEFPWLLRG